jgi:hypothetical protein
MPSYLSYIYFGNTQPEFTMSRRHESEPNPTGSDHRYGEELLRANWNPVLDLLQWSCERTRAMTREAPAARSDAEAAAFLRRVYSSGA